MGISPNLRLDKYLPHAKWSGIAKTKFKAELLRIQRQTSVLFTESVFITYVFYVYFCAYSVQNVCLNSALYFRKHYKLNLPLSDQII